MTTMKDRLRFTRNLRKIRLQADLQFDKSHLTLFVDVTSNLDGRRSLIKKIFGIAVWMILASCLLTILGGNRSLTTEWSRRHNGGDVALIEEMLRTGYRPSAVSGFQLKEKPVNSVWLLMNDPALLGTMTACFVLIGAASTLLTRNMPETFWDVIGICFDIPTEEDLERAAEDFSKELADKIKR
jgi:hypothetical protein